MWGIAASRPTALGTRALISPPRRVPGTTCGVADFLGRGDPRSRPASSGVQRAYTRRTSRARRSLPASALFPLPPACPAGALAHRPPPSPRCAVAEGRQRRRDRLGGGKARHWNRAIFTRTLGSLTAHPFRQAAYCDPGLISALRLRSHTTHAASTTYKTPLPVHRRSVRAAQRRVQLPHSHAVACAELCRCFRCPSPASSASCAAWVGSVGHRVAGSHALSPL